MVVEKYCPACSRRFPAGTAACPDDGSALIPVPQEDLLGQVVDRRYRVIEMIGQGGMGVIYRAEHQILKRPVALKIVRRDLVQDETSVKRFLTEARAIASLKCAHTVTIYDSGVTDDGTLYYTMELLTGRPLSAVLRSLGALAYPRAVGLVCQVCESLEEAHGKGIVHRDIKPDNIFITQEEGRDFVKLVDFGIAKVLDDPGEGPHTRTGMLCGTPRYLSPEQVSGEKPGPATDLYALGIVLYEMLAGAPPFSGPTPAQLMHQHLSESPPPLPQITPGASIPPALNSVLLKALEKDPAMRYASAAQFARALLDAQGTVSVLDATLTDTPFSQELTSTRTPAGTGQSQLPREAQVDATLDAPSFSADTLDIDGLTQTAAQPTPAGISTPGRPESTHQMVFAAPTERTQPEAAEQTAALRSGLLPGLALGVGLAMAVALVVLWAVGWRPGDTPEPSPVQTVAPEASVEQETDRSVAQALSPELPVAAEDIVQDSGASGVAASAPDARPELAEVPRLQPSAAEMPADSDATSHDIVDDRQKAHDLPGRPLDVADEHAQKARELPDAAPEQKPAEVEKPRIRKPRIPSAGTDDKKKKEEKQEDWFQGVEKLPEG